VRLVGFYDKEVNACILEDEIYLFYENEKKR